MVPGEVEEAKLKYDRNYEIHLLRQITGWGRTAGGVGQPASNELLGADLNSVNCQTYYPFPDPNWICAGDATIGGCQGDSGGPLHSDDGHVIGLVSFGRLAQNCLA